MAELTFKQKLLRKLYDFGLKNFGGDVLGELKKGSAEWFEFVGEIMKSDDYVTRKVVLKQLMNKNFLEKSSRREELIDLMLQFLTAKKTIGDEKQTALKFVSSNLALFPGEDDRFRAAILSLSRDTDITLSTVAGAMLPKIGVNMDDRELYRRG